MNKRDWVVLAVLVSDGYENQRALANRTGFSIGLVNSSLKRLEEAGYIDESYQITDKTRAYIQENKPQRAVILAAGMGHRMTPINHIPKGLLKVGGVPLIERIIRQLQGVGISEIYVVVGYQMEKFEYLIDAYGVKLIYNHEFAARDTLHSLRLAADKLENCYVVPASIWFSRNPFNKYEYFTWYAVGEYIDEDSYVRLNRKMELVYTDEERNGNAMIGLCYLTKEDAKKVRRQLERLDGMRKYTRERWERALFEGEKLMGYARVMQGQSTYEIQTYEQLRELDSESQDLRSKRLRLIGQVFGVSTEEITDISPLLISMTNRLMHFTVKGTRYLLREPGEGSNVLTNRTQEAEVYRALEGTGLTEKVIYISPEDGYKISEYIEGSRVCDSGNKEDVSACIQHLRRLHDMRLEVPHAFNVTEKLVQYERLRDGLSPFEDYELVRSNIVKLMKILDRLPKSWCLCHIDPVSDNFLFVGDKVYLIDWEYAGMCDRNIDIAMFCLYADYNKEQIDEVISLYYPEGVTMISRFKVYAYIAASGLLWSVWCDYKKKMGVDFGEYSMKQYRYAKNFYAYAMALADKLGLSLETA